MKESEIRQKDLMQRYIELSGEDVKHFFSVGGRREIPCVACGSMDMSEKFSKNGFAYVLCRECGTLFQSPRPPLEEFEEFYRNSKSSRYWAEVFFPSVAEVRREKIIKPRAERLALICEENGLEVTKLIDVGAGYGIFLEEWRGIKPQTELLAVEPSIELAAECRNKGINVVELMLENVTGYDEYADLVVCFEVLEHVDNPLEFITVLKKMVRPGGYLFITTLCIDGFDLQILGEKSSQISPPHHINFLSVLGFEKIFNRAGLNDVVVTTPGKLDVDIVYNNMEANTELLKQNLFIKKILDNKQVSKAFQTFLSENQLSSHAWIMGRKK